MIADIEAQFRIYVEIHSIIFYMCSIEFRIVQLESETNPIMSLNVLVHTLKFNVRLSHIYLGIFLDISLNNF